MTADIAKYRPYFDRAPDKAITLTVATSALPLITVQFMSIDTAYFHPVEWLDGMPEMNWLSTGKQVRWILRDDATGKENDAIDWHVKRGSVVKLRIFNDPQVVSPDAASDSPARPADAGRIARRGARRGTWSGRTRC